MTRCFDCTHWRKRVSDNHSDTCSLYAIILQPVCTPPKGCTKFERKER